MKSKTDKKNGAAPPAKKTPAGSKPAEEKKQEVAVQSNELSAELADMLAQDAGGGMENMTTSDMAIPRLSILQSNSPQVKKREGTYIEGAEEGMIIDTVTSQIFNGEEGIYVVPCSYRKTHLEWIPREKGGGLAGDHGCDEAILKTCTKDDKGRWVNEAGNNIIPTSEYYLLVVDIETGVARPYVLSMASTQLGKARKWNTTMNMLRIVAGGKQINPPMFYKAYKLTTVPESNEHGSWFGWKIEMHDVDVPNLPSGMDIYNAARALKESVNSGTVKAATHEAPSAPAGEEDDAPM